MLETDEEIERALNSQARITGKGKVSGNVGLNADWNVSAWAVTPGRPNRTQGMLYVLDDERGTLQLVQRYYGEGEAAEKLDEVGVDIDFGGRRNKIFTISTEEATEKGAGHLMAEVADYLARNDRHPNGVWPVHQKWESSPSTGRGGRLEERIDEFLGGSRRLEEARDGQAVASWMKKNMPGKFNIDKSRDDYVMAMTRQSGSVGREEPGKADVRDAHDFVKKAAEKFPGWGWANNAVDEWVEIIAKKGGTPRAFRSTRKIPPSE